MNALLKLWTFKPATITLQNEEYYKWNVLQSNCVE